jgi:DNA repair exonuclease SbcCD nuclease subunit
VDEEPQRLHFPERDLSILAVPDMPGRAPSFNPDREFSRNVLLLHGEISGVIPRHAAADDRPAMAIDPADLHAPAWNYVALGHYHVHHQVAPNAFYSGALDYTSSNPWGELKEDADRGVTGKGFIEYDLDEGTHTFHRIPGIRAHVDLPPVSARGLTSVELDDIIRERVTLCEGGIEDKVVRLVVRDVPRHIARELDHSAIRSYKRRALNFLLDTRRPELTRTHGQGAPGSRRSLEDTVRDKLNVRPLEGDIDRLALIDMGLAYLRQAEAATALKVETDA